jgi:hypothetical protein
MAKKKTTRARLVERAAAAKRGSRTATARAKQLPRSGGKASAGKAPAPAAGALAIPALQTDDIQETVRNVVGYVQQNPLGAAAVAIGVGVMLASMYWDNKADAPPRARAPR